MKVYFEDGIRIEEYDFEDWENGEIYTAHPMSQSYKQVVNGEIFYRIIKRADWVKIQEAAKQFHLKKIEDRFIYLKNQLDSWLNNSPDKEKTREDEIYKFEVILGKRKFSSREEKAKALKILAASEISKNAYWPAPTKVGEYQYIYEKLTKARSHYEIEKYELTNHPKYGDDGKDHDWITVKAIVKYLEYLNPKPNLTHFEHALVIEYKSSARYIEHLTADDHKKLGGNGLRKAFYEIKKRLPKPHELDNVIEALKEFPNAQKAAINDREMLE